jgi:hypothetical protein
MKNIFILILGTFLFQGILSSQCVFGDCRNGFGEIIYKDSSRFVGYFQNGTKASGNYFYRNNDEFNGVFIEGKRQGFGIYRHANGDLFKGLFVDDKKTDGTYYYQSGDIYTGCIENSKPNGFGRMQFKDGRVFEGQWKDGKPEWTVAINLVSDTSLIVPANKRPDVEDGVDSKLIKGAAPRVFAVIVGISDYDGFFSDLRYADDDAERFYQQLKLSMPKETSSGKVVQLKNSQATAQNVLNALDDVFARANENDFLIFYFSGHGSPGYFIPTDHYSNKISHEAIKQRFKDAKGKYRLCIADACFAGSVGNEESNYSSISSTQTLKDSRLAVILSSKSTQTSQETSALQQGLFSYYLIKGLRGAADINKDKYVTAGEVFVYTRNRVVEQSGGKQIPVIYGQNIDRIPLSKIK